MVTPKPGFLAWKFDRPLQQLQITSQSPYLYKDE